MKTGLQQRFFIASFCFSLERPFSFQISFLRILFPVLEIVPLISFLRIELDREAKQLLRPLVHSVVLCAEISSISVAPENIPFFDLSVRVRMTVSSVDA